MLHTVNKSPFERNSLQTCIANLDDKGVILLIEDGVIGATNTDKSFLISELASSGRVYALTADLEARGIADKVIDGIKLVDYKDFVDLVIEHKSSASWL